METLKTQLKLGQIRLETTELHNRQVITKTRSHLKNPLFLQVRRVHLLGRLDDALHRTGAQVVGREPDAHPEPGPFFCVFMASPLWLSIARTVG